MGSMARRSADLFNPSQRANGLPHSAARVLSLPRTAMCGGLDPRYLQPTHLAAPGGQQQQPRGEGQQPHRPTCRRQAHACGKKQQYVIVQLGAWQSMAPQLQSFRSGLHRNPPGHTVLAVRWCPKCLLSPQRPPCSPSRRHAVPYARAVADAASCPKVAPAVQVYNAQLRRHSDCLPQKPYRSGLRHLFAQGRTRQGAS